MPDRFQVNLTKDSLVFSAAHFITFNGNVCERLHGHNWRAQVEVAGPLDENYYVIDFIALRDAVAELVAELDHRMLLPTRHRMIHVAAGDHEVEVTFEDRRWVFPADDCRLLPVENTTAELIARYLGQRLLERLTPAPLTAEHELTVAIDENNGQWGVCRLAGG